MKVLKLAEVVERTGLSPSTIERKEKRDEFPARKILGTRSVGWLESDIDAWIKALPTKQSAEDALGGVS